MANVYDFRSGRSIKGCNPQAVGEELERLRIEKGALKPVDVLEAASSPESPLHHAFEWDDSAAAQQHRLNQARRLIVSIRILNSPTAKPTTAYVSVRTPGQGRSYVPTTEAMSDEDIAARVLDEIRQFIESMERRYAHFEQARAVLAGFKQKAG